MPQRVHQGQDPSAGVMFSPMAGRWRINLDPIRRCGRWARGQLARLITRANVLLFFGAISAFGGVIIIYRFFWIELPEATKRAAMEVKRPVLSMRHVFAEWNSSTGEQRIRFDVSNDEGTKEAAPGFQPHALIPVDAPIELLTEAKKTEVEGRTYFDLTDKPYPYAFHPGALYQSISVRWLKKEERFHVLWYITSPTDGTFPGSNKDGTPQYGRIEIEYFPR